MGAPRITACYIYPVKGMTPLAQEHAHLEAGKSVVGDRGFAFAFANARTQAAVRWVNKHEAVTLLNTPHLAGIQAGFDPEARVLTIAAPEEIRQANVDSEPERQELAAWFTDVVRALPANPLLGRPEREPLRLMGTGQSVYTDRAPRQISLGAVESLAAVSEAAHLDVDFRRFRLNFAIEGAAAWDEFDWTGKRVRIGESILVEVLAPLQRCNAINASPEGIGRDLDVVAVLKQNFDHLDFGIEARVLEPGRVAVGDPVVVEG